MHFSSAIILAIIAGLVSSSFAIPTINSDESATDDLSCPDHCKKDLECKSRSCTAWQTFGGWCTVSFHIGGV
ncbi:uncharacterized protein EDB93DRAFT_1140791, partial [Suillus bovinus]|uniref:uncharacterized protein n=1 Tax=Suillus bovinus TaxID=48563 RepID=UPI001B862043